MGAIVVLGRRMVGVGVMGMVRRESVLAVMVVVVVLLKTQVNPLLVDILVMWVLHTVHFMHAGGSCVGRRVTGLGCCGG